MTIISIWTLTLFLSRTLLLAITTTTATHARSLLSRRYNLIRIGHWPSRQVVLLNDHHHPSSNAWTDNMNSYNKVDVPFMETTNGGHRGRALLLRKWSTLNNKLASVTRHGSYCFIGHYHLNDQTCDARLPRQIWWSYMFNIDRLWSPSSSK